MIEPHPSAPDGVVIPSRPYLPSDFVPSSAILCRNTAPLVAFAYSLLHRDIPCRILGRDIGVALANLVKKMNAGDDLALCEKKLGEWRDRETTKALDSGRSPERIEDQYLCLTTFINALDESSRTVRDLLAKIDLLFSDTEGVGKLTLCTIHRSKGLEWPTVFLLDFHLIPSRYATQRWQLEQERNLAYVATTRTMDRLIYINTDNWKTTT